MNQKKNTRKLEVSADVIKELKMSGDIVIFDPLYLAVNCDIEDNTFAFTAPPKSLIENCCGIEEKITALMERKGIPVFLYEGDSNLYRLVKDDDAKGQIVHSDSSMLAICHYRDIQNINAFLTLTTLCGCPPAVIRNFDGIISSETFSDGVNGLTGFGEDDRFLIAPIGSRNYYVLGDTSLRNIEHKDNKLFVLRQNFGIVIATEAESPSFFGKHVYYQHQGEDFTLVFSSDMKDMECLLNKEKKFPICVDFADEKNYFIVDKRNQICGISSCANFNCDVLTRSVISKFGLHTVSIETFQKNVDTSSYAIHLAAAIHTLDPKDMLTYFEKRIRGQGVELQKAVYLVWQYLKSIAEGGGMNAFNWFLTAPSGCGKTEFYRTLRQYLKDNEIPLPVVQVDLGRMTEEGYKGINPSYIIDYMRNEGTDSNGYGICFLDEADKKLIPSFSSHGENVNAAVQNGLLTLIEGVSSDMDKDGNTKNFDTGKTMFIFIGAFQDFRNERKRNSTKHVGFSAAAEEAEKPKADFYAPLTIDDIIEFGMQEELAGRIQQVINFRRLSEKDMLDLIRAKTEDIGKEIGYLIKLTPQAEKELLEIAYDKLGVRKPLNKIRELALNTASVHFFTDKAQTDSDYILFSSLEKVELVHPKKTRQKSDSGKKTKTSAKTKLESLVYDGLIT